MNQLVEDITKMSSAERTVDPSRKARLIEALWTSSELLDHTGPSQGPDAAQYEAARSELTAPQVSDKIISSLSYQGMTDRGERIVIPYPDTFNWLFDNEHVDHECAAHVKHFTSWLQTPQDQAFWITGKPASGKSTLMKFISTHVVLRQHLEQWAGGLPLLITSFYFWGPGSAFQKSLPGLLCSLLHQLLSQRPDLCDVVAPRRRALFDIAGVGAKSPPWELTELRESLVRFARRVQNQARLAFFIDGLDEFGGSHIELVTLLKKLHRDHNVKLCVASRPWNIFSDEFRQSPSLKMEDLTKPDIDRYITGRLGQSIAMQQLQALEPDSIANLIDDIRIRAEGVFLWVVLVVEQLLITASDTPHLSEIWKVFDTLPGDLETLYDTIHGNIDPAKMEITSKLYRLVMEWKQTWNSRTEAMVLWAAIHCSDPTQPVTFPAAGKEDAIMPLLQRLMVGHTKGILQLSPPAGSKGGRTVDFLHRTAFDWLRMEDKWDKIRTQSESFHPLLTLIAVLVGQLRTLASIPADAEVSKSRQLAHASRIFRLSAAVASAPGAGNKLIKILGQISSESLLPSDAHQTIFRKEELPVLGIGDHADNCVDAMAAAWSCFAYLQAKCDADHQLLRPKNHRPDTLVDVLDASVLGIPFPKPSDPDYEWRVWQRLETVNLLLRGGARPSPALEKMAQARATSGTAVSTWERQYWQVVWENLKRSSRQTKWSFGRRRKRDAFQNIPKPLGEPGFPDFEIPVRYR